MPPLLAEFRLFIQVLIFYHFADPPGAYPLPVIRARNPLTDAWGRSGTWAMADMAYIENVILNVLIKRVRYPWEAC